MLVRQLLRTAPKIGRLNKKSNAGALVTLVHGDGIGRELNEVVQKVFDAAGANVSWDVIDANSGNIRAKQDEIFESIRRNKIALKGHFRDESVYQGSFNTQLYKHLDLFANFTHCRNFPNVKSRHQEVDFVVIRENTEGEYSGLEHEVVPGVMESLKIISEKASTRIARFAFEFALEHGRSKVTAVHKANIMKKGDGLFLDCCRRIAREYSSIEYEEMIVDNTSMQLTMRPQQFDVMVMPNLYGNFVTNIGAGVIGGAGLCSGGSVGGPFAIFEQGSRHIGLDIAGKGLANPTGTILCGSMLLRHIGQVEAAFAIEQAVERTFADGVLTRDVGGEHSTSAFANAVVERLRG